MDSSGLAVLLLVVFLVAVVVIVGSAFYNVIAEAFPVLSIAIVALSAIVAFALIAMYAINNRS